MKLVDKEYHAKQLCCSFAAHDLPLGLFEDMHPGSGLQPHSVSHGCLPAYITANQHQVGKGKETGQQWQRW